MRLKLTGVLTSGALLLFASSASADVRYAAPNGDGPPTRCPRFNPCTIVDAVEDPSVADGDEVVLRPGGTYFVVGELDVDNAIDLHGVPGKARPLISAALPGEEALNVDAAAHIHDLSAHSDNEVTIDTFGASPVIERVTATSEGTKACLPPEAPGVLRDSVCVTHGISAEAVGEFVVGSGDITYRIRNVTAIATGPGSWGVRFQTDDLNLQIDARNVIADGVANDILAAESGTGTVSVKMSHSNYNSASFTGAGATVSPVGVGTNQTEPPLFANAAAGNFHERPGSPTINAGRSSDQLGKLDLDRQPRVQGGAPDIGADELDRVLRVKIGAKSHQRAGKLKVKASCPKEECTLFAKGTARAQGKTFQLSNTRERFLARGQHRTMKLKAKHLGRLKHLLREGGGRAKITVKGTDAGGVPGKKTVAVALTG